MSLDSIHRYCTGQTQEVLEFNCLKQLPTQTPQINWPVWWHDLFQVLSWGMVLVLLVSGVYLLISDLSKETRTGTLTFIRTSPRSASNILLGKLLGVPAIPFLVVLVGVPLHSWAAVQSQVPLYALLSFYGFVTGVTAVCYAGALLFALLGGIPMLGGSQGWLGAAAVAGGVWIAFQSWYAENEGLQAHSIRGARPFFGLHQYFYQTIDSRLAYALPLGLLTVGMATYWIWQALLRRFGDPNATLLSKGQSYLATASFELWLLGFICYSVEADATQYPVPYMVTGDLAVLGLMNFVWFMLLIAALTPDRQPLMDWVRYQVGEQRVRKGNRWLQALLLGARSPALGAIALNLILTGLIFLPWILSRPARYSDGAWMMLTDQALQALATLLLGGLFLLICAAIAQILLFLKSPKRGIWTWASVAGLCFGPPILLIVFGFYPPNHATLWLFTSAAFVGLGYSDSMLEVVGSVLAHGVVLGALTFYLSQRLRRAGASEWQALMQQQSPRRSLKAP